MTDPEPFPASMAWLLDNPVARIQANRLVRRLPVEPGMRVVDVGCGPGRVTVPVGRIVGEGGEVVQDAGGDMAVLDTPLAGWPGKLRTSSRRLS